jgi:hypothetical protein
MSANNVFVDPSSLTVEQLTELLNAKNTSPIKIVKRGNDVRDKETDIKKCSFKPTRTNQTDCDQNADIFFGKTGYCSKHRRSVQALNAKKNMEEEEKQKTSEQLISPAPTSKPEDSQKLVPENKSSQGESLEKQNDSSSSLKSGLSPGGPEISDRSVPNISTKTGKSQVTMNAIPPKKTVIKKKIKPNTWGRFEDPDTGIVFDAKTKMAYGVQDHTTGKVVSLSKKHIALCEKYKWKYYILPEVAEEIDEDLEEEEVDGVCQVCGYQNDECECVDEEVDEDAEEEEDLEDEEEEIEEEIEEDLDEEEDLEEDADEAEEEEEDLEEEDE